jgi:hypothetical protein
MISEINILNGLYKNIANINILNENYGLNLIKIKEGYK